MIPLHDDNPTRITPVVTYVLLISCVLIFLWQLSLGEQSGRIIYALGVIPAVLFEHKVLPDSIELVPAWLSIITSMFLHGGWMHLLGNMLYLYIFANNIEEAMGHTRFLIFYLTCGVAAALAQSLPEPESTIPMIGASGAISGVLGAYLLLFPTARVLVVVPLGFYFHSFRIQAFWVLGFWFVLQLVNTVLNSSQEGGVAWGAHIGGFIAGLLLVGLFKKSHYKLLFSGK